MITMRDKTKERLWIVFWLVLAAAMIHGCVSGKGNAPTQYDPENWCPHEELTPLGVECW